MEILQMKKTRIGFTVEATMSDIDELFYEEYFILSGPAASALDLAGFEISDIEYDFYNTYYIA